MKFAQWLALGLLGMVASAPVRGEERLFPLTAFASSEQRGATASMAVDQDARTYWQSRFGTGRETLPQDLTINLGRLTYVYGFSCLPRQDGEEGRIADYACYVSRDGREWSGPVSEGRFARGIAAQRVTFGKRYDARFLRLRVLSAHDRMPRASVAEIAPLTAAKDTPLASLDVLPGKGPWSLASIWWRFEPLAEPFSSYRVSFTVEGEIPEDVRLFIAPAGWGSFNGATFNAGLQTATEAWPHKNTRRPRGIGPAAVFTRWGETRIPLNECRAPVDGGVLGAGARDEVLTVCRAFAWGPGRYTFTLLREDFERVDGKDFTWVGAYVRDHQTDTLAYVGSLRFPGDKLVPDPNVAAYVEIYGPPVAIASIPDLRITFDYPRYNGRPLGLKRCHANYPKTSGDHANVAVDGSAVVLETGQPFLHKRRDEDLPLRTPRPTSPNP